MRTTNNLFRRVLNCTHSKWWFTQFERKCNILEIFHYFQYFERFRSMKKWQISKPKIVDWYLDFSNESYTTLKSVISSFKMCFQNYGQLKRNFLRPKNTSSTFLKFELSRLGGQMLKTRKNTIWPLTNRGKPGRVERGRRRGQGKHLSHHGWGIQSWSYTSAWSPWNQVLRLTWETQWCPAWDPRRKAQGPPQQLRHSWMPGSPCKKGKGMCGAKTVEEGGPTHFQNPLRTAASPELEPKRKKRGIRARKSQNAKLRAPRLPGTIWHVVAMHVPLRSWIWRWQRQWRSDILHDSRP